MREVEGEQRKGCKTSKMSVYVSQSLSGRIMQLAPPRTFLSYSVVEVLLSQLRKRTPQYTSLSVFWNHLCPLPAICLALKSGTHVYLSGAPLVLHLRPAQTLAGYPGYQYA